MSTELDKTDGVDVEDVPSAAWGWSKENPRVIHGLLIFSALFMLAMLKGNHTGKVEDLFLVGFAVLLLAIAARDWWMRRRGWTR